MGWKRKGVHETIALFVYAVLKEKVSKMIGVRDFKSLSILDEVHNI